MKRNHLYLVVLLFILLQISFIHSQNLDSLNLIAHYPLSSTANDTTGNYDPMELTNTPFQDGGIYCNGIYPDGNPLACDVYTPNITALNLTSFAVSATFKIDSIFNIRRPVLVCGRHYKWSTVFTDPDTTISLSQSNSLFNAPSSGTPFSSDTWHEITFVYDSTEGMGRLYLDGTVIDSSDNSLDHGNDKTFSVTHGSEGRTFNGYLKDLKIYSMLPQLTDLEKDSLALVALYNSTDGDNWTNNENWKTGQLDTWHGITVTGDRVSKVNLSNNNLAGVIPAKIGNLTNLTSLYLEENQLTGTIPGEIGNLTTLTNLSFYKNQFTGTIPAEIWGLTNLTSLTLSRNQLTGAIPGEIRNLTNLTSLSLSFNQLTGSIPTDICNLTGLTNLSIGSNQLTGTIPEDIGNLTDLIYLYFNDNQLTGTIPSEIGNLTNLNYLSLSENQITGVIPTDFRNLTKLKRIYLQGNQLTGTIPSEIGNLRSLQVLNLRENQLMSAIPTEIGNLTELTILSLYKNQFTGAIPSEISNLTKLNYLEIYENHFHDLPDLSSISSFIELTAHNNHFTFEDIEPNIGITGFTYIPQDSVGEKQDTTITEGENLTLSIDVGGTSNKYQWKKNGVPIEGAVNSEYLIETATLSDSGSYTCQITNTVVTDLTLNTHPIKVNVMSSSDVSDAETTIPHCFNLLQNYPNPFNPETIIRYHVANDCHVSLKVYNIKGQEIVTLVNTKQNKGEYEVNFQSSNMPSGIYVYKIEMSDFKEVKKMIKIE